MKSVLLQGVTGSIGSSALSVAREQKDKLCFTGFAAFRNEQALLSLASEWKPRSIALVDPRDAAGFRLSARELGVTEIFSGPTALSEQAATQEYDLLVNAVTGSAGILPTLAALDRGINVALANKETLVAAGELVMEKARARNAAVLPIDSEHSALFQCLTGEAPEHVRRLWLTASGGPFWGWERSRLASITPNQALAHPTWAMGPKNTVDSATLFNKGLEVIEAVRLFGLPVSKIEVVRQKSSVVHSLVEFVDGSYKAQLSRPDMRLPILFAISYPERWPSALVSGAPPTFGALEFEEIAPADYPCLALAFAAIERGGTAPAVVSAADEIAVQSFLTGALRYDQIARILEATLEQCAIEPATSLEAVVHADAVARAAARSAVSRISLDHPVNSC